MKRLWTVSILFLTMGCGMTVYQRASGKVETNNSVKAEIVVDFPLCNNDEWTYEMKMECVRLCNQYNVRVSTDENLSKVLEQLQAMQKQNEAAIQPTQVDGGI